MRMESSVQIFRDLGAKSIHCNQTRTAAHNLTLLSTTFVACCFAQYFRPFNRHFTQALSVVKLADIVVSKASQTDYLSLELFS